MKSIERYDSILAAVEYENPYEEVGRCLQESEILKNLGFQVVPNPNLNYGISMLRLSPVKPAQIQINQGRIQYEDNIVSIEDAAKISDVMDVLEKEHEKITADKNIKFSGVILKATYELEKEEKEEIMNRLFKSDKEFKNGELRLNYWDENKLNFNIFFNLKISNLAVSFDINTRYVENKSEWNIGKITDKIRENMENVENIKKMILENK